MYTLRQGTPITIISWRCHIKVENIGDLELVPVCRYMLPYSGCTPYHRGLRYTSCGSIPSSRGLHYTSGPFWSHIHLQPVLNHKLATYILATYQTFSHGRTPSRRGLQYMSVLDHIVGNWDLLKIACNTYSFQLDVHPLAGDSITVVAYRCHVEVGNLWSWTSNKYYPTWTYTLQQGTPI